MKSNNLRLLPLICLTAHLVTACLESGGACTNACRAIVDCESETLALSPADKRVRLHECRIQCRDQFWSVDYADCLSSSQGDCVEIEACPFSSEIPDEYLERYGDDTGDSGDEPCNIDCFERRCYLGNLYCYDNCGNPSHIYQYCDSGCTGNRCNG